MIAKRCSSQQTAGSLPNEPATSACTMSEENDDQYFHTYVPMVESALSAVVDDVLQRRPKQPLAEICSTLYEKYGRQTSGLRQSRTSSEAMVDSSSSGGLKMDAAGGSR